MSREEKLKAIIEKAVKSGCPIEINGTLVSGPLAFSTVSQLPPEQYAAYVSKQSYAVIIFSHDFAKAFWGESDQIIGHMSCKHVPQRECPYVDMTAWQYQIQKLALTPPEDRIDYLYKFVNE